LKRLFQHIFGNKLDINDLLNTDVKQVLGGKEIRELAEQLAIIELKDDERKSTSNKKKAMSKQRMEELINKMNGNETD